MRPYTILSALALAAPALGQSNPINIDIGNAAGTPSSAYATHAGGGVWNSVPHDATAFPLVFSNGMPSTATITITGGSAFAFDHPGTTGDDQALMDDGSRSAGTQTITIHNASQYDFYAYAWSSDSATTFTDVAYPGLAGSLTVGGAWPGAQAWQTTYESFSNCDFVLDDLVITVAPAAGSAFGTINGLQINGDGGGGCRICTGVSWAPCPCGNPGFPDTGCDNAQATGGVRLRVLMQSTSPNGATLRGDGFPPASSPTALVLRASMMESSPVTFGDGLRCVSTQDLRRLAATTAVGGVSTHTIGHSAMAGPGEFYYQIWYRNMPSSFCSPSAFNLSAMEWLVW